MKKKNNAGMTLVEVIVAVAIFAFATTPLLGVFSYSLRMERMSLTRTLIACIAQMEMEKAYGMDEEELLLMYGDRYGYGGDEYPIELYYRYSAVPFLEPDPDDENSLNYSNFNLYKVTITIGNELYKVETTLEDIFYARPTESGL